jgi:hypothetical protein
LLRVMWKRGNGIRGMVGSWRSGDEEALCGGAGVRHNPGTRIQEGFKQAFGKIGRKR